MGAYGSPQLGPYSENNVHNKNQLNTSKEKAINALVALIVIGSMAFGFIMMASYDIVTKDNEKLVEQNNQLKDELNRYKKLSDDTTYVEGGIESSNDENRATNQNNKETVLSGAGNYYLGKDFESGMYDIEYIEGTGMATTYIERNGQLIAATNIIMVYNSDSDVQSYKNIEFKADNRDEETRINIEGNLKIRLKRAE